jgi:TPR repeat protein
MARFSPEPEDYSAHSRRLWRARFGGLLYVPQRARPTLAILEQSGRAAFLLELERLTSLGSPAGAAMLGYLALNPGPGARGDPQRAIELCRGHAEAGDPYAQWVYAWGLLLSGRHGDGLAIMTRSAAARFPPAAIAMVGLLWSIGGKNRSHAAQALKTLRVAAASGHAGTLRMRCLLYRSGRFGVARWLLGVVLTPVGVAHTVLAVLRAPFSARVFTYQRLKSPLLLPERRLPP